MDIVRYKSRIQSIIGLSVVIIVAGIVLSPQTHMKLGNIFFGQVPRLYNVNYAHLFFSYAAYAPVFSAPEFAHYQLSRTLFIRGQLNRSLFEAEEELRLYPQNARTYYILGLTYGYLNQEHKAIEAFASFIEVYPRSWAARNDMAWLQFRIGDIEGAYETIESVAWIENPWIQNTYGTIMMNRGEYAEAEKAFLKAQEMASQMTEEEWGKAYPGNNPRIYGIGIQAMLLSIANNLEIISEKLILTD